MRLGPTGETVRPGRCRDKGGGGRQAWAAAAGLLLLAGRVQASGTDPYRHVPIDPALASLRDDWLFPPECRDRIPVCTIMNHPRSPTI